MKTKLSFAALLLAAAVAMPAQTSADQGRGRGHDKPAKVDKAKPRANDRVVFDRAGHVRVISDYRRGSLPPGLAKRKSLPPGLAKQIRERGHLPPGLEKRWIGVPGDLAARLPAVPPYYHRYFVGDDLVVVDTRDNTIAYLIRDVLR